MKNAYISGAGTTRFGRHDGCGPIDLMAMAAQEAITEAGVTRQAIDGVLCGYATTLPHLMLASLVSERLALRPLYAHGLQMGGATGAGMVMLASELVRSGRCRRVLVVAGENRASGQSRDGAIQTLAQVGDADFEVPNGASVPAYYALLASRYLHEHGLSEADLAEFAVLMRRHAAGHPHAQLTSLITVADVLASKPIASPLKLLDCCPISDGAVALIVSDEPADNEGQPITVTGAGQAHHHQHVSAIASTTDFGASASVGRALTEAGCGLADIDYLAIYDSFTITLAVLLEEIGICARGACPQRLRDGAFGVDGELPLNTHGGMLSFGHSGVGGGLAHIAETYRQLAQRAGTRQIAPRKRALVHADGGVLSAHVSLVLERQ